MRTTYSSLFCFIHSPTAFFCFQNDRRFPCNRIYIICHTIRTESIWHIFAKKKRTPNTVCAKSIAILFQHGNCIRDGLFKCFSAILIDLGFILFAVSQASCAADTAADARHALDDVAVENVLALL